MRHLTAVIAISALLQGCLSTPNCVAIVDPNETLLNGKVIAKAEAKDVQLAQSRGKVVNDMDDAEALLLMSSIAVGGAVGAAGASYVRSTRTPTVGDDCGGSAREVRHGWRYAVAAEDGHTYTVASAYGGFNLNECVRLYVSKHDGQLQGRIAQGGACDRSR